MSEAPSIPDEDILLMLRLSYWIGSASPKYSNLPILRIIEKYSALVLAQNGTLSPEDLTEYFGTPPSDIPGFLKIIGGIDNLSGWTPIIAEYQYLLPHPRNIGIILPLFLVFLVVTSIAVALRMISRHRVGGGLRSFDWLTLVAHLMAVAYGGLALHSSRLIGPYEACHDDNKIVALLVLLPNDDYGLYPVGSLVWALPIPMVFQLKLYPRQRILALCTFGVGAFAVVASGLRLDSLIENLSLNARGTSTLIIDAWTMGFQAIEWFSHTLLIITSPNKHSTFAFKPRLSSLNPLDVKLRISLRS
ncbi:hypothetical protein TWF191_003866 [Orbilia oligospora]|uniref:Rhodopsin domain-containing protein n=1 Tax=Orbilia oligospora TaxID=2813651 RepID=A0A7C8V3S9_ORBOL|nr:hypothetical protein TWF191_003866 [Orbilia oligospora]